MIALGVANDFAPAEAKFNISLPHPISSEGELRVRAWATHPPR